MNKRQPTAAQARYRMRFSTHAVPDSARNSVSKFNRIWLGKAMAFVAVFSLVFSTVSPVLAQSVNSNNANSNNSNSNNGNGNNEGNKIQICHKEGNGSYNQIEVNVNGLNGHDGHEDDIIPAPENGCPTGNSIPENLIVITGSTTGTENDKGKWFFNRDTSTDTPYEFNFDENSIGDGSLYVFPIGAAAADKMIGEYFIQEPIANVNEITYDFMIGGPAATVEEHFYMNVYANFGVSDDLKFYDCRYSVVPTIGSVGGFTTVSFDPTQAYPVTTRTGAQASPFTCPAVPADMDLLSPGSNFRTIALNVGDTSASDTGISGYLDNVVLDLDTIKTTYDFEPKTPSNVTIEKVWQDANGNEIPAPSNKDEITIEVESGNDEITCEYNANGILECDDEIESFSGDSIEVTETGLPAGWETVESTVGEVVPNCEVNDIKKVANIVVDQDDENEVDCTHTVINKRVQTPVCSTELVVNGGFEVPEVTNFLKFQYFSAGDTGLGWSVDEANSDTNTVIEYQENFSGWQAHGGNQYAELDSIKSTKIYQDLPTRNGGVYTVSLWTAPKPITGPNENKVEVKMGGQILETVTSSGLTPPYLKLKWTQHTYTFTATSDITRLEITDRGNSNAFGSFVDDVSVTEDCISDVTICKFDNNQEPLAGWNVFLKGEKLETVTVPASDEDGVSTANPLDAGQDYLFVASGTADAGDSIEFDADYSYRTGSSTTWTDAVSTYEGFGDTLLDLQVDGSSVSWDDNATYNTNHKYYYFFSGADASTTFKVNDTFPSNNNGSLTVDIYPVFKGVTNENGCVTMDNIDYGSYKLDELMKDGWINLSGQNTTALVDAPTEQFNLVNKCTKACESQVKVCKVNDDKGNTPLPGWTVFLKGKLVETVQVNSATSTGATTGAVLENGKQYLAVASGEWSNRSGEKVDAKYTTMNNWVTPLEAPDGGYADTLLELQVNDGFVNWGPYDSSHAYNYLMTGAGSTAKFRVYDFPDQASADSSSSVWFGDNNGTLTVRIYEVYSGVTGEDGCVTLADVPYGTYELGEIMKDGWINEYGMDEDVVVNSPTEGPDPLLDQEVPDFTLINACVDGEKCDLPDEEPQPCVDKDINDVFSGEDTEFLGLVEGSAPVNLYDASGYTGGTPGAAVAAGPTGFPGAWDGAINDPSTPDGVYVSNSATQPTNGGPAGFNGAVNSWRLFSHTFTIPAGATNISVPTLHFAGDNEVTVFLDASTTPLSFTNSFNSITNVSLGALTPGVHVLKFAVKNDAYTGGPDNPTGVIYELDDITFDCEDDENPQTALVDGIVYYDSNNDGNQDEGEGPIEGMTIQLILASPDGEDDNSDLDETIVSTDVTDIDGYYSFNATQECYIVREIPDSYVITEPASSAKEYYISVLGAFCDFDAVEEAAPVVEGFVTSLFNIKTANAAAPNVDFVAFVGQDLPFGNFQSNGGGNNGGGSSSGSSSNNDDNGSVAGDSTNIPFVAPTPEGRVLGAVTSLPVTGNPTWIILAALLLAAPMYYFRKVSIKADAKN